MKREIIAAVMGYGTVGRGVCELLSGRGALLAARSDTERVALKYVLDIRDLSGTPAAPYWVRSVDAIVDDPEVNVVVEAMGGTEPAFTFCSRCLAAGKSVVTSNKQLVAEKGEALFALAGEHNVSFRFGAAVCGGIPALRTLVYGLAANRILGFNGILNGTTNFILTKMIKEKTSMAAALREAQDRGYAEADPAADIEGQDACRKTAILCSLAFGAHVFPEEIPTRGIAQITPEDVAYADDYGAAVKLLGRGSRCPDGSIRASVGPALVKKSSLLANVEGVYNALELIGDKVGSVILYGQGAGRDATASAVAADVLDCGRKPGFDPVYSWGAAEGKKMAAPGGERGRLYIRGFANDRPAAIAALRESFGGLTLLFRSDAPENEIAFVTPEDREAALLQQLKEVPAFAAAAVIPVADC